MSEQVAAPKNKWVFVLLTYFLGLFGVQYFYVGKKKAGIINLICGLLCITSIVPMITSCCCFWGALLRNPEKFNEIYVDSDKTMPLF